MLVLPIMHSQAILPSFPPSLPPSLVMDYPNYYTQPFHAYEDGNLNWLAAAEVESATSAMCLRVGREGRREGGHCCLVWQITLSFTLTSHPHPLLYLSLSLTSSPLLPFPPSHLPRFGPRTPASSLSKPKTA